MLTMKQALKRTPLAIPDPPPPATFDDFAERCEKELGYSTAKDAERNAAALTKVAEAFAALAFAPLDRDAVEKWKASRAGMPPGVRIVLSFFATSSVLCFIVGFGMLPYSFYAPVPLGVGFSFLMGCLSVVMNSSAAFWRETQLKSYNKPVPKFALTTAMEIGERLDASKVVHWFEVHHLEHRSDPFLVLWAAGQRFYLEVWEETGFDVQREI